MLELAERAEPEIRGPNQVPWLDRLEAEIDNLRVAVQWAEARDPESFSRLANALWRFCDFRGNIVEGLHWLTSALDFGDLITTATRPRTLARASYLSVNLSMPEQAERLAREGAQLARDLDDKLSLAMCLMALGLQGVQVHQDATVRSLLEQGLMLAREISEHGLASVFLYGFGMVAKLRNETDSELSWMEAALQEARLSGDKRRISYVLRNLSRIALLRGEFGRADSLMWEARQLAVELGDARTVIYTELQLIDNVLHREDFVAAEAHLDEADGLAHSRGEKDLIVATLNTRGLIAWAEGDLSRAVRLLQDALPLSQQEADLQSLAMVLYWLGEVERKQGDHTGARARYTEALHISEQVKSHWVQQFCLQGFGAIARERRQAKRAVRLFAASAKWAQVHYIDDFYRFLVRQREAQIAETRAQLGEEAFNAAWRAGQAMSEEEMVAYALENSALD